MSTMNMPVLLKTTYRFNTLSIKMPMAFSFFIEIEKNSKTHVKVQMTPNSQRHPKEKTSTARGTTISKFKLYDSIIITKSIILAQNRHTDQSNCPEEPKMNQHRYRYSYMTPNKGGTKTYLRQKVASPVNGRKQILTYERLEVYF